MRTSGLNGVSLDGLEKRLSACDRDEDMADAAAIRESRDLSWTTESGGTYAAICHDELSGGGVPPSECGDGVVDAERGEACDDGNRLAGDGCVACQIELVYAG
jgi:cysteine-rich repeat protein